METARSLIAEYQNATEKGHRVAFATVVKVLGSAFRQPGARMLIRDDGVTFGALSGGCLEKDVAIRAQDVIKRGRPVILQYGLSGSDDDVIFGVGSGCNGSIEVLVERSDSALTAVEFVERCYRKHTCGVIATVTKVSQRSLLAGFDLRGIDETDAADGFANDDSETSDAGEPYQPVRDAELLKHQMPQLALSDSDAIDDSDLAELDSEPTPSELFDTDNSDIHNFDIQNFEPESEFRLGDKRFFQEFDQDDNADDDDQFNIFAKEALETRKSIWRVIETPAGAAFVFFEFIAPPIKLIVCGSGRDAMEVAAFAERLSWDVALCTLRPKQERDLCRFNLIEDEESAVRELVESDRVAVVIMTHSYEHDLDLLNCLALCAPNYLGVLGPKHRSLRLIQDVAARVGLDPQSFESLYAPIGLDIGAETETEIALSIVAEVQAVLNDRSGGQLRHRGKPIHDRAEQCQVWDENVDSGGAKCSL